MTDIACKAISRTRTQMILLMDGTTIFSYCVESEKVFRGIGLLAVFFLLF